MNSIWGNNEMIPGLGSLNLLIKVDLPELGKFVGVGRHIGIVLVYAIYHLMIHESNMGLGESLIISPFH